MNLVTIVGRPNVGKSTLFNRLVGRRLAIVSNVKGTTRDRVSANVQTDNASFTIMDTGGLESKPSSNLWEMVKEQVDVAISQSDAIIFLGDAVSGTMSEDQDIAKLLRTTGKPCVLAINKCDNYSHEVLVHEFQKLGLGNPLPISAMNNRGINELLAEVISKLPNLEKGMDTDIDTMRLAIIGRVNVGKSSLLNAMLDKKRAIVSSVPGTTRDATDSIMEYKGKPLTLIDTAGIRRRGKIEPGIEKYSVVRTITAIERANIALLMLDATEPATSQDIHIAGYAYEAYKGLAIIVNKWDLAERKGISRTKIIETVRRNLLFVPYVPILFASALNRIGIEGIIDTSYKLYDERRHIVEGAFLNSTMITALAKNPPTSKGRRQLQIYKVSQDHLEPPTFTFLVNDPSLIHFSYQRYLENVLRSECGYQATHIKLNFKKSRKRDVDYNI